MMDAFHSRNFYFIQLKTFANLGWGTRLQEYGKTRAAGLERIAKNTEILDGAVMLADKWSPRDVAANLQPLQEQMRTAALDGELRESDLVIDDVIALIPDYPRLLSRQYFPAKVGDSWTYESNGADVTSTVLGKEGPSLSTTRTGRETPLSTEPSWQLFAGRYGFVATMLAYFIAPLR